MLDTVSSFFKTSFSSWDANIVYGLVFIAIFIPIVFWKREEFVDRSLPMGDWKRMPRLFKLMWRPSYIVETTIGAAFAKMFQRQARKYSELAEIASLQLTGRRVFVTKVIYALLFGIVGASVFLFVPTVPLGVADAVEVVMVALGWMLPSLALSSVAQLRQEEIVKTLPFAIDLIGAAMRAGLEFGAAMRYYWGTTAPCATSSRACCARRRWASRYRTACRKWPDASASSLLRLLQASSHTASPSAPRSPTRSRYTAPRCAGNGSALRSRRRLVRLR